jgi:hypothetical protein
LLLAAAAHGWTGLYRIDPNASLSAEELQERAEAALEGVKAAPSAAPQGVTLQHAYTTKLCKDLTSMHGNCDDTLMAGSGYTHSVCIADLNTGQRLRKLQSIHTGHINIARFANMMPYLLLTSVPASVPGSLIVSFFSCSQSFPVCSVLVWRQLFVRQEYEDVRPSMWRSRVCVRCAGTFRQQSEADLHMP